MELAGEVVVLTADGATGLDPLSGRPVPCTPASSCSAGHQGRRLGATSPEDTLEAHPAGKSGLITPEAQEVPEMTTIATTTRTREERARADRERRTRYAKRRRLKLLEGTWQSTLVPADSARAHLISLHEQGWSIASLEALVGVRSGGLASLLYENHHAVAHFVTRDREAQILDLDIDLDRVPGGCHVPSLGAVRRVHALNAVGWSLLAVAQRSGVSKQALASSLSRDMITARVARQIRDIYAELEMSTGPSERSRRHAAAKGWAPPAAWDDIDDPAEQPDASRWEKGKTLGTLTMDDLTDCASWGLTREQTGRRLGVKADSVETWLDRHDVPDLRAHFARNEAAA